MLTGEFLKKVQDLGGIAAAEKHWRLVPATLLRWQDGAVPSSSTLQRVLDDLGWLPIQVWYDKSPVPLRTEVLPLYPPPTAEQQAVYYESFRQRRMAVTSDVRKQYNIDYQTKRFNSFRDWAVSYGLSPWRVACLFEVDERVAEAWFNGFRPARDIRSIVEYTADGLICFAEIDHCSYKDQRQFKPPEKLSQESVLFGTWVQSYGVNALADKLGILPVTVTRWAKGQKPRKKEHIDAIKELSDSTIDFNKDDRCMFCLLVAGAGIGPRKFIAKGTVTSAKTDKAAELTKAGILCTCGGEAKIKEAARLQMQARQTNSPRWRQMQLDIFQPDVQKAIEAKGGMHSVASSLGVTLQDLNNWVIRPPQVKHLIAFQHWFWKTSKETVARPWEEIWMPRASSFEDMRVISTMLWGDYRGKGCFTVAMEDLILAAPYAGEMVLESKAYIPTGTLNRWRNGEEPAESKMGNLRGTLQQFSDDRLIDIEKRDDGGWYLVYEEYEPEVLIWKPKTN